MGFRPILMTTLAAPARRGTAGDRERARLRPPSLGITRSAGSWCSQILTLYTTPVIYLLLDRLHRKLGGKGAPAPAAAPAE